MGGPRKDHTPRPDTEERIARLQQLVAARKDTGYYPLSMLDAGSDSSDLEEFESRYTPVAGGGRGTGRQ